MSAHVEPHEAQAILDAVRPAPAGDPSAGSVAPRDFGRPLRLSPRALDDLRRAAQAALADCERDLARALRGDCALELAELAEVSVEGLFDQLAEPFALVRFDAGGQPAWTQWQLAGAVAAVEVALGAPAPAGEERPLTSVERRLLLRLLSGLAARLGAALGLEVGAGHVVEDPEQAGSWRDGGPGADRARLRLHLAFEGPGGASGIDLWLPGALASVVDESDPPAALPGHLEEVGVALTARLGARDVPLAELLAVEEGDVIPLDACGDGLVRVVIEGVTCATARLGSSAGRLALRIETVGPADDDNP